MLISSIQQNIYILFNTLFHMVYHRILNIILCTIQQGLVVYPFYM